MTIGRPPGAKNKIQRNNQKVQISVWFTTREREHISHKLMQRNARARHIRPPLSLSAFVREALLKGLKVPYPKRVRRQGPPRGRVSLWLSQSELERVKRRTRSDRSPTITQLNGLPSVSDFTRRCVLAGLPR